MKGNQVNKLARETLTKTALYTSLSTIVGINTKKHGDPLFHASITCLTILLTRKNHYSMITAFLRENPNSAIGREFYNFLSLPVFGLPAGLPAVRPTSTRIMIPDFHTTRKSHSIYKTVFAIKIYPLRHGFSFYPSQSFLFFLYPLTTCGVDQDVALSADYVTQMASCIHVR